jgi:hypothetical protein
LFRFVDLNRQLLIEIGDAVIEAFDAGARFHELACCGRGLAALQFEPVLRAGEVLLREAEAASQLLHLGAHGDQFDLSALGDLGAVVEFGGETGEFALLVGESAIGSSEGFGFGGEFAFSGCELLFHRRLARFQIEDSCGFFTQLDLHPVDGVGLLAEFGELVGGLALELFDAHFQPPCRHGEFGAELVLVGLDFGHRQRCRSFEPAGCQAHSAVVHQRHDKQAAQHRGQKTDRQIHDRLDHGTMLPRAEKSRLTCHARAGKDSVTPC